MIKKIIYLHGLESQQGGEKVDFLSQNSLVLYAPKLDYKNPNEFQRILKEVQSFEPDLIIGSSMGGYMAYLIASHLNIPVLLFNPALHHRTLELNVVSYGKYEVIGMCVLGGKDEVIDYKITYELINEKNIKVYVEEKMEHRTSLELFIKYFNLYKKQL